MVYSRTLQDHIDHARKTLRILRRHRLYAKVSKCAFFRHQVEYLGHVVTAEGIKLDPTKVQAVSNWKVPAIVHGVRSFRGLTSHYLGLFLTSRGLRPLSQISPRRLPMALVPKGGGCLQCIEAGFAQRPYTPVGRCG